MHKRAIQPTILYTATMTNTTAIILAAGKGTRFNSEKPKVLHHIFKKPMVHHVIETVQLANINSICLVVGYKQEDVRSECQNYKLTYAVQEEQLGTGHAVICGLKEVDVTQSKQCIVLAGDCPLIQTSTINSLLEIHSSTNDAATVLTAKLNDAGQYGRIIRNQDNQITAIREAKDCTEAELNIQEFNSVIYCFNTAELTNSIDQLKTNNAQNEYYLTDVIESLSLSNKVVSGLCVDHPLEVSGANTPAELTAMAEEAVHHFNLSQ